MTSPFLYEHPVKFDWIVKDFEFILVWKFMVKQIAARSQIIKWKPLKGWSMYNKSNI